MKRLRLFEAGIAAILLTMTSTNCFACSMAWANPEVAQSEERQFFTYDEVFVARILSVEHIEKKSDGDFSSWVAQYELVEPLLGNPPSTGAVSDPETECGWGLGPQSVGKSAVFFIERDGNIRRIGTMNSTTITPGSPEAEALLGRLRTYSKQKP
jgi:hypothetical protein